MIAHLAIGLPILLLCLILQATASFWSVRYYVRHSVLRATGGGCSRKSGRC